MALPTPSTTAAAIPLFAAGEYEKRSESGGQNADNLFHKFSLLNIEFLSGANPTLASYESVVKSKSRFL